MSSLAEKYRFLGDYVPGYGVCGGANRDCAVQRSELDPLDQLFYDHDQIKFANTQEERIKFDEALYKGVRNLTDSDFSKIPLFTWKRPFFKRWYAHEFSKVCIKIFEDKAASKN